MFSFNIDGGRAIQLAADAQKYSINGQEHEWNHIPVIGADTIQGALAELSDILGGGRNTSPDGGVRRKRQGKMEIWC